jgi:hypothetical protein
MSRYVIRHCNTFHEPWVTYQTIPISADPEPPPKSTKGKRKIITQSLSLNLHVVGLHFVESITGIEEIVVRPLVNPVSRRGRNDLINQLLIKRVPLSIVIDNGKIGQGMRSCKCTNHNLYTGGCQWQWQVCVSDAMVSVCMSRWVSVCVSFLLISFKLSSGCLFSPHHDNQGGVQKATPQVTLYEPHTAEESLRRCRSGRNSKEFPHLVRMDRCCLVIRTRWGNSDTCCFHHMRGSVSWGTCCTLV